MRQQADGNLLAGGGHACRARADGCRPWRAGREFLARGRAGDWSRRSCAEGTTTIWWPARAHLATRLRDVADALGRAHRGAAVFVNDQCHAGAKGRGGTQRDAGSAARCKAANSSRRRWRAGLASRRLDGAVLDGTQSSAVAGSPAGARRAHRCPARARRPAGPRGTAAAAALPGGTPRDLVLLLQAARAPARASRNRSPPCARPQFERARREAPAPPAASRRARRRHPSRATRI